MTEFIEATFTSGTVNAAEPVMNNVFIYTAPSLLGNPNSYAAGLVNAFTETDMLITGVTGKFFEYWLQLLSNSIAIKSVAVRNLYNPLDFAELSLPLPLGAQDSDALSPASALSYRAARARTGRNRWRKRYSGIPEARWNRGFLSPEVTYEAALQRWGLAQEAGLDGTDGETVRTYLPAVLYTVTEVVEGQKFYRRPFTALEAEGLFERVSGIEYSTVVASQVTRKTAPTYVPADVT